MSSYHKFDNSDFLVDLTDSANVPAGETNPVTNGEVVAVAEEEKRTNGRGSRLSRTSSLGQDPDQIEVSLEEGAANPTDEVLQRAAGFFVDNNDNYNVSWEDASHMISDSQEDPSKPPVPGWNEEYVRWRLRRAIEGIYFRLTTLILIVVDLIIIVVDLAMGKDAPYGLKVSDFVLSVYFMLELGLRMVALRPQVFFIHWYNVLDLVVVVCTFIISCVALNGAPWVDGLTLFVALRFVRIVRIVRIVTEKKNLETGARQLISQNKRRYQQDGFDLDLTYVTNRVIATSFPSSGLWSVYRNPIEKVAAFLNTKHAGHYKIFNLCSERTYDTTFFNDQVERVMIDDHNVPSVEQMLAFANQVRDWLGESPENVIVVHCKGGKGRTGTMICVWLIESGVFSSASLSLDYFGHRRTDTNVGSKFQGVETPSQSRYVGYYEWVKNNGRVLPVAVPVRITEISVTGVMYMGQGDGSDFWVTVDQGRGNTVFTANFGTQNNCKASYNSATDTLVVQLVNCPMLRGDTRVMFQTSSRQVPRNYEKCPFYFWFHTGFVKEGKLVLSREELDNPHKSKTWHCFREMLAVDLRFEYCTEEE